MATAEAEAEVVQNSDSDRIVEPYPHRITKMKMADGSRILRRNRPGTKAKVRI